MKLVTGTIKKEVNKIDYFSMSFYLNNPAHGKLKPFKTLVNVFNTKTGKNEFEGRVLNPNSDMDDDGLHSYDYECEGVLGYLHDSQQKHLEFRGRPEELFIELLNYHNSQVEDYKKFHPGIMEVTTSTDNLYVYLSAESSTFEEIKDKILDRVGGELRIRKANGIRYLDVLERVGEDKQTPIKIAKNLRSVSRSVDPTDIITRLTPLGTRIESEDEEETDASQARLTIEEVNNGLPYLDNHSLIAEFGIQGGSVTWDDITLPNRLLSTGQNWLANQKVAHTQYEISAVDLSLIGLDIDNFEVGNSHPVINPIMGIDERLRIIGKTTNINSPQDASLKIGDKFKTLDEYQADANKSARKVVELESIVNNQSSKIGGLLEQINNVNTEIGNVKNIIVDADIEELSGAISALETAINNLNDALDSIPIYDVATNTQDGLMASADKVKLDGLLNYSEATEILAGLMSAKDKQKLNRLTVTQSIDLDQLYQDVQTLLGN
nr:phage tail protein [Sporosarcina sp. 6E9]